MQLFKFKLFLCFDLVLNGRVLASRGHDERFIMSSDTVPTRRHNHLLRRRTQRLPIHLPPRLSHLLTRLVVTATCLTQSCIFVVSGCLNLGQVELSFWLALAEGLFLDLLVQCLRYFHLAALSGGKCLLMLGVWIIGTM